MANNNSKILKAWMKKNRYSAASLAAETGIATAQTIRRWARGVQRPTIEHTQALEKVTKRNVKKAGW